MNYQQIIARVQNFTGIEDPEDADKVLRAVLQTMGERLPRTHREHMAAQLPEELKSTLAQHKNMEFLLLEEFLERVANRANVGYHKAVKYVEAIARVLREAIAPGELKDILAGFPEEYKTLFGEKPSGQVSSTAT